MKSESDFSLEGRLTSFAQPDTLLPGQYLANVRREVLLEPERKLMLAVLEDGVLCFQCYFLARDSKGESLFHDAESWVLEQNDDRIFSFENLCEALGLDPKYVRQGLLHWKERKLAKRCKAGVYRLASTEKVKNPLLMMPGKTGNGFLKAVRH